MTLVPRPASVTFDPNDELAINLAPINDKPDAEGDLIGAAFRQENVIGSLVARQWAGGEYDPSYNPWNDIKGTPYEEFWDQFTVAGNKGQTAALKRQIDIELEDRNTLAAAGGWGILASIGAGIFSPENLLPGGTIVRSLRVGAAAGRTFMRTASAAAIAAGTAEVGLHATQELRTPLESAFNVGSSALLGGTLGAGLSALFSKADWVRYSKAVEAELRQAAGEVPSDIAVAVRDEMVKRLVGVGRSEPDAAKEAALYGAFYQTMAKRTGLSVDALLERMPLPDVRLGGASGEGSLFQPAWHGSPHVFDKFKWTDKTRGTGEGAQAFGDGLYFAGKKDVARYYRDALTADLPTIVTIDGAPINRTRDGNVADTAIGHVEQHGSVDEALKAMRGFRDAQARLGERYTPDVARWNAAIDWLETNRERITTSKESGRLYKVDIPGDDELMLWDAPLSEQPPKVKEVLERLLGIEGDVVAMRRRLDEIMIERDVLARDREQPSNRMRDEPKWHRLSTEAEGLRAELDALSSGERLYDRLGAKLAGKDLMVREDRNALASQALREAGIPGHRFLDEGSRNKRDWTIKEIKGPDGEPRYQPVDADGNTGTPYRYREDAEKFLREQERTYNYVIYDDSRVAITEFEQRNAGGARGSIEFGDAAPIVRLFESADASTFLHETGHFFLDSYKKIAAAAPELAEDWKALSRYLDIGDDGVVSVAAHEKFARSFEAYLRDGKAPSPALKSAFDQFKEWLVAIYRSVAELNVPISDDVRGFFDRMLATDDAIARSRDPLRANEDAIMADLGAAARGFESLEENTIAGRAAQVAGGAVRFLNPVLRVLHSSSPVTRSIGTQLFENPIYLKKNLAGVASNPAVETLVKEYTQGAMARAVAAANGLYGDFRKAGGSLNREQWSQAIGRAMRRGDVDPDPTIASAAKAWRSSVFDPLKDMAIKAGLLPKDVSVDTALSYFSRVYNRPRIEAREAEFKAIVRRYIDREVRNAESRSAMHALDPRGDAAPAKTPDFLNEADRAAYVEQIVDDIFNTITGRNADGDIPRDIVAATRGPLKERTFHIPDEEIEEFLESNVEAVARRYARTMAADIELTRQFGKADMKEQIAQVRADYLRQRAAVEKNVDPETGRVLEKPRDAAAKEKAIKQLVAAENTDVRDIEALRDMVRGSYLAKENTTNFARVARVAGTINYLRVMGGVTLTSMTDVARHVMVHGFSGVMLDGLVPMMRNLKGFKMSVEEARIAGAVTDRLLNTRMATWADINDPYSVNSPFERFMDNAAAGFSRLNGLVYWNDFQKSFASVITQNRVLRGSGNYTSIGKREKAYLAYLGIDESMAERITRQFDKHGTVEDGGIRVAHTDDWDDEIARRTYRAAINKDVDSTIVTKGVGDVPLFAHTPTGRMLLQFKGFAMASHQRALMRGLQERPMGFVAGGLLAATVGMMIYWLKSIESNRAEDVSDNPGRWIAEGLDRSGMFAIAFEANNTVEKAFGIGAYGAMASLFPEASQEGKASKYLQRGIVETLTGPTGALVDGIVAAGNTLKPNKDGQYEWTEGEVNALKRLLPGSTLPGIRSMVEYMGVPAALEALN